MSVSIAQRVQYAYDAGFRNTAQVEGLSIIVSISLAECGMGSACETGCNPDCCGCGCSSGCQSCGIWQIFQPCHPGTAACAKNPACCATIAWSLSHNTGFTAWSTFNNGAFRAHLDAVRQTIASMPPPIGPAPQPSPTPTPTPAPTPSPTPTSESSAGLAILLLVGAAGAAWYAMRGRNVTVAGVQDFGEGHVAVQRQKTPAGRSAPARASSAFGSR